MENASKALIIAGTILIVMLVIGAGMVLFGKAGNLSGAVQSNWSQDEIKAFNKQFTQFEGTQKGSTVKSLIETVNRSNERSDVDVGIDGFVNKSSDGKFYPTSQLINSRNYNVSITEYDAGVVKTIVISEIK